MGSRQNNNENVPDALSESRRMAFLLAAVAAAAALAAAVYYFLGDACKSSERIDVFYAAPVLFGVAGLFYAARVVTSDARRWWLSLAAGVATGLVSAGVLGVLAFIHYAAGGCYT